MTWVYYLDDGRGRIKIRYSKNVRARIREFKTIYPEIELVAQERGGCAKESERHDQFKEDWISGEWFHKSDKLIEWIGFVRSSGTFWVYRDIFDQILADNSVAEEYGGIVGWV